MCYGQRCISAGRLAALNGRGARAKNCPVTCNRWLERTWSTTSYGQIPGAAVSLEGGPWKRLTLLPLLHGRFEGPGSGAEAAEVIRQCTPRQVLVELCSTRYAEVLAGAIVKLPRQSPLRLDILGNIHGGLLGHEMAPVLLAAREVGAAVVPVDRSRAATRSRVAHRLWHPKLLQGLLRYGSESIRHRYMTALPGNGEDLRRRLETGCPAAYQVLIDERCHYMAHQVRAVVVPDAEVVVVCGALHTAALAQALQRPPKTPIDLAQLAARFLPVWPFFLIAYVVVPGMVACYGVTCAWASYIAPMLVDAAEQ